MDFSTLLSILNYWAEGEGRGVFIVCIPLAYLTCIAIVSAIHLDNEFCSSSARIANIVFELALAITSGLIIGIVSALLQIPMPLLVGAAAGVLTFGAGVSIAGIINKFI